MTFSKALKLLKKGRLIAQKDWETSCLYMVSNDTVTFNRKDGYELEFPPQIYISDGYINPQPYYFTNSDI